MRMDFNDAMECSRIMQISFINIFLNQFDNFIFEGYYMGE